MRSHLQREPSHSSNPQKTVELQLLGLNGNAFALMAAFARQARKEGWSKDSIDAVLDDARSGDYDHLLSTLSKHCEPGVQSD